MHGSGIITTHVYNSYIIALTSTSTFTEWIKYSQPQEYFIDLLKPEN